MKTVVGIVGFVVLAVFAQQSHAGKLFKVLEVMGESAVDFVTCAYFVVTQ